MIPTLAEMIGDHALTDTPTWANERLCKCGATVRALMPGPSHAQHVAAAIREARTITTLEQLDALPTGTVVRTSNAAICALSTHGVMQVVGHFTHVPQLGGKSLPARVLWTPEDDAS